MFGQSLLSAFGSAACTTDTDQLFTTDVQTTSLATYQLNNATTSIPSNTYPGTASNITYAAGKFGDAAVFNGSSSKITSSLGLTGNPVFSISFWIKPTSSGGTPIMFGTNSTNQAFLTYKTAGSKLNFGRWGDSLGNTTASIPTGYWTHVAISNNAGNVQVYINGIADLSFSTTYNITGNNFYTGAASNTQWFNGSIDQVRIFSTALPQSAVTALYNETTTTATYPYVTSEVANPNSIAYYKMSDATDQFGNYNGTATNVNFNTEGKFGFAGAFNGLQNSSASYINISSSTTSTTSSVSLWFNTTVKDSNYGNILDAGGGSSGNTGFAIIRRPTTGFLQVIFTGGTVGSTQSFIGSTDITDGNWHNVVLSMASDNTFVFYLDGLSHLSGTRTKFTVGQSQNLSINRFGTNAGSIGASSYSGSIDQIRIYDSALSAANVTTLYNEIECPAVAVTNAFNTVLYTGNSTNDQSITGVGFKPDFVWIKSRNTGTGTNYHGLWDSVRGTGGQLYSELTNPETNTPNRLYSFDSDGFSLGNGVDPEYIGNNNYVSWNWKAAGFANSYNILEGDTITSGSTASSVGLGTGTNLTSYSISANRDAGFSIINYSPNGSPEIVPHGLNKKPQLVLTKSQSITSDWYCLTDLIDGSIDWVFLNTTGAAVNTSDTLTDTTFSTAWGSGSIISYAFHSVAGYSKVGSYNGGSTNTIVTGFQPRFLMVKKTNASGTGWYIFDAARNPSNPRDLTLFANSSAAEAVEGSFYQPSFLPTGFSWPVADGSGVNISGGNYIFLAIA